MDSPILTSEWFRASETGLGMECGGVKSATELLKEDHKVIQEVLDSLEAVLASVKSGNDVPVQILDDAVRFSQGFVDRCHHGKEEACLFPCLERRGIPREGGPIGVMLYEHQVGREIVRKIQSLLEAYKNNPAASNELLSVCSEYVAHLRQHIFKEENILFHMGDAVMNQEDNRVSVECYERTEEQTLGLGKHEEMLNLAKKIGSSKPLEEWRA